MIYASVNWPRILGEIAWHLGTDVQDMPDGRRALGTRELAKRIGFPRSSIRRWLEDGAEPRHCDGEALIARWMQLTGRPRELVPVVHPVLSAYASAIRARATAPR